MKIRGLIIFAGSLILTIQTLAQQRPFVNSLSKYSAPAGEVITINGSNFVANSQMNFGAGKASFTFKSSTQLEVTVPTNAVYAPVTVTNLDNGLSGSSSRFFTLSFGGSDLNASDFDVDDLFEFGETGQKLIWDVCLCDLDEDNKLDAVTTHRETSGVKVYRNNSTLTSTVFNENTTLTAPTDFSNIILCQDLDGDGKKDLIFSSVLTGVFSIKYYRNNSTPGVINMVEVSTFSLPKNSANDNRSSNRIQLADIDGDGKIDLVVGSDTNIDNPIDAKAFIYLNTSTIGNISFISASTEITIPDGSKSALVEVGDLNGNGKPDLVVTANGTGSIYLYKNKSLPGTVMFADAVTFNSQAARENIKIIDLNNDGLGDLVHANEANNNIVIYSNNTIDETGDISFVQTKTISISSAYGIDAGDLNGDGLVDLAISTLVNNGIKVIENTTSNGVIDFATPVSIEVPKNPNSSQKAVRNIKISDVNGDSKPDLVFALNSQTQQDGIFSVITNRNCLSPSITPESLSFCYDIPFSLTAPKAFGVGYTWEATNAAGASFVTNGELVDVTIPSGNPNPVSIKLTMTSNDGNCVDVVTQNFSVQNGTESTTPVINNSAAGTICGGDDFTLSTPTTGAAYLWVLPDGSELTASQIVVTGASDANAGIYSLRIQEAGKCYGDAGVINVAIDSPPSLSIVNQDSKDNFCAVGDNVTLEVPEYPGFSLKWFKNGVDATTTTKSLITTTSGVFTVDVISDATGCATSSDSYEVFAIIPPSAMFNAGAEICVDLPLAFEGTSTGETGFAMTHTWDFGDGNSATGLNVSHTFTTANTFTVMLTSSYDDVDICSDIMSMDVVVSAVPVLTFTLPDGSTDKCPSDSVKLELPQGFQSYLWSSGDTDFFTYAKTASDQSSVEISAEVVTAIGCSVSIDVLTISNYANSGITITADGFTNNNDTISLESGIKSVTLNASTTGGTNYMWGANDLNILSETTGETTEVFPKEAFTTITATATDVNSCTESQIIVIEKPGLQARRAFSPNNDGLNECWEIINSEDQAGCTVYIFDTRGSQVFSGNSPFTDNCVWNGKVNGTGGDVPEGIYFFVLKCDDNSSSQTGTILLAH
ncbi:MAG: gliding motility-associated-like protein [Cyclobacteriaceae bacterium]|jgi:gliding motility-associated-like protein